VTFWKRLIAIGAICSAQMSAAQFGFSTLIRWGAGLTPATSWEMAVGNTPASLSATNDATPQFSTDSTRLFQVDYAKATNTATVRLYDSATGAGSSDIVSFSPAGGASVISNAVWRLPSASFFLQSAPDVSLSQVDVRNLTLVAGTVISPFQTTPMTSTQFLGIGAGTINHNGDVVFVGNAAGDWRIQGLVRMTNVGAASANGLIFGMTATASDVPEPMTSALIGFGLLCIAVRGRRGYKPRRRSL
jgi:PEP-CTERM motif